MSSDPVGAAIAAAAIPNEPSSLHSSALPHSLDLRTSTSNVSVAHDVVSDEDDDDDFVVFQDSDALPAPRLGEQIDGDESEKKQSKSKIGLARGSIDSLTFGFQDHLLPLSMSGDGEDTLADHYGDPEGSTAASRQFRGRADPRLKSQRRTKRRGQTERRVTLIDGIALTIGVQIGSGIFSSPGVVTLNTGSIGASMLVWLISGILAWTGASSFAELGASIPLNGGSQAYLNYSFGPMAAFLYTWSALTALKPGAGAIIATIFAEYVARMMYHVTGKATGLDEIPSWSIKLLAVLVAAVITCAHAVSNKLSTRTQVATTAVKLLALSAVPVLAIVQAARGKMPESSIHAFSSVSRLFEGSSTSPSSYALALYSGLWAFDAWDQSCFVAGEMKRVERDLPRVINISMATVILIFLSAVASYYVVLPVDLVQKTNTVALDFGRAIGGTTGGVMFACLVAFSCFGALNGQIYTTARLILSAANERHIPSVFGNLHHRTATPVSALVLQFILISAFIIFGSGFASLVNFYGVCSWTFYLASVLGLLVLRIKEPNLPRPYKTFLSTPILFAAVALFLLLMPIGSAPLEGLAALLFISAGIPVFYLTQGQSSLVGKFPRLARLFGPDINDSESRGRHQPIPTSDVGGREDDEEETMEMLPHERASVDSGRK